MTTKRAIVRGDVLKRACLASALRYDASDAVVVGEPCPRCALVDRCINLDHKAVQVRYRRNLNRGRRNCPKNRWISGVAFLGVLTTVTRSRPIPAKRMAIRYTKPCAEKRVAFRSVHWMRPQKRWFSAADSSAFCRLSPPEDAIPRKRMGIRHAERMSSRRPTLRFCSAFCGEAIVVPNVNMVVSIQRGVRGDSLSTAENDRRGYRQPFLKSSADFWSAQCQST